MLPVLYLDQKSPLLNGIRCIVKDRLSMKKLFISQLTISPDLHNSCVPKSVIDIVGCWGLRAARSVSISAVCILNALQL